MAIRPELIPVSVGILDGMPVHRRFTASIKFADTHLYTWVERGILRVKSLAKNTTQGPQPGLEPGPLDLELGSLTMWPPHLPNVLTYSNNIYCTQRQGLYSFELFKFHDFP